MSAVHFLPDNKEELTRLDITEMMAGWAANEVTNRGLIVESLSDAAEQLETTTSAELPQGAKAVVDVWYTAKAK